MPKLGYSIELNGHPFISFITVGESGKTVYPMGRTCHNCLFRNNDGVPTEDCQHAKDRKIAFGIRQEGPMPTEIDHTPVAPYCTFFAPYYAD